ncbi:MAG: hypothetical protein ACI955_002870 [Zhongshania sp.]|jgi:hypothetical protein
MHNAARTRSFVVVSFVAVFFVTKQATEKLSLLLALL